MTNGQSVASARKVLAWALGTVAAFVLFFGAGQGSWSIAALGVAVLVLAISLVAVTGLRGGSRGWVAGSAHVVSASEPPASSAYGRCELQIVIDAVGVPAAAVKVRDARVPVAKWPDAGATLPIMVSVDDPRRVQIQWDDVLTHAEAAIEDELAFYHDPHASLPRHPGDPAGTPTASPGLPPGEPSPVGTATATATRTQDAIHPDTVDLASEVGSIHAQEAGPDHPEDPLGPDDPKRFRPRRTDTAPISPPHDSEEGVAGTEDVDGADVEGADAGDTGVEDTEDADHDRDADPTGHHELSRPHPPVIITQTPEGPVVEGWVVERPDGPGSTLGGPAPTDTPDSDPTAQSAHPGTFPLPRRRPNPNLFREPEIRKPEAGHHTPPTASPGAGTTGTTGTGATTAVHPDDAGRLTTPMMQRSTEERRSEQPITRERPADDDLVADEFSEQPFDAYPDTDTGAPPAPPGPIHGVGITALVTDLQRSIDFYRDMLGFFEIDGGEGNAVLASGDTRLVLRAIPDVAPVNRRVVHLNLEVADVEATYQELRDKGVEFTYAPRPVNKGERLELWAAAFRDPDGHVIAITQWRNRIPF